TGDGGGRFGHLRGGTKPSIDVLRRGAHMVDETQDGAADEEQLCLRMRLPQLLVQQLEEAEKVGAAEGHLRSLHAIADRGIDEDVATPERSWRMREQIQAQALQARSKHRIGQR